MRNAKFNSKETYLAYRSEWKAEYNQLSQEIRQLKIDIRETQRANGDAGLLQRWLIEERARATAMIEERNASKVRAQEQYLAAKATLTPA